MDGKEKKIIKLALASFAGCSPLFFIILLIVPIFLILGLFGDGGSNSNNGKVAYDSECNFENTMVTVMDVNNEVILATVSLEDYVIGCAVYEIGGSDGAYSSRDMETYAKAQFIASKTWLLSTKNYDSSTKSVVVRAGTNDQQWCDLEKGCYDKDYGNNLIATYPGGYNGEAAQRKMTESDLEIAHQYYQDTYGELFLPNDYNKAITSLNSTTATFYVSTTQNFWNKQGQAGKTYEEALKLTGTTPGNPGAGYNTGLSNSDISSYYENKSIYRLRDYCKTTNSGSSGLEEAIGDVEYLSGGLKIPIYYQGDYADVMLDSEHSIETSGCGFTSTAMIVSYLTGKKITPRELVNDWSRKYYIPDTGMDWGLPQAAADHYNLGNVEQTTDSSKMLKALKEGHPVMCSQGPGLFTGSGHLIVLRGVTNDGKILVNDPNSYNAKTNGYNTREFTLSEIKAALLNYWIWPKKS